MATQEQTQNDTDIIIHTGVRTRVGQKLTPSSFLITKLSFLLRKIGTPEDLNITFTIRQTDDTILGSKVLGLASALQVTDNWEEVTFDSAVFVNQEVRISCEYAGTTNYPNDAIVLRYKASDVAASEIMDWYPTGGPWSGGSGGIYDAAYKFTYTSISAPTVTTQAVTSILGLTATGNGNITDEGGDSVTQHGVCWNTTGTPTTSDDKTEEGAAGGTGAFTSDMTGLLARTTYFVRAYATNGAGTSYGSEVSFTTNPNEFAAIGAIWFEGADLHGIDANADEQVFEGV